jgi:hypothetical protein
MNGKAEGAKKWMIPDGYIPPKSSNKLLSHESVCVLNTSGSDAHLTFTIFFEDRDPLVNIHETVGAMRTRHIRTASLSAEGQKIPVGVPYAIVVESDINVVVQYSRLDTTQKELALMSVVAHPL